MMIEGFDIDLDKVPSHIAIIMDGNGRWAKKRKLKRLYGHHKGAENLINIIKTIKEINVKTLSVFAFSTENWKRSQQEVNGLMKIFVDFYNKKFDSLKKEKVKVIHTGVLTNLSEKVKEILYKMQTETKTFNGPILNLVLNYGGRLEITDAIKKIAQKVKNNQLNIEDINSNTFSKYLYHPEIKEPDLLIRTSGELRISNFMIWQLAYTELWFTNTLWPDFSKKDLINAIFDYQNRERRFGKIR